MRKLPISSISVAVHQGTVKGADCWGGGKRRRRSSLGPATHILQTLPPVVKGAMFSRIKNMKNNDILLYFILK